MASFRLVRAAENFCWPSGDYRAAAVLALAPDELERRLGAPLVSGVEAGLGPWRGAGLELASGRRVELVRYEHAPTPGGFELRADADDDVAAARADALAALGLSAAHVVWVPPEVGP